MPSDLLITLGIHSGVGDGGHGLIDYGCLFFPNKFHLACSIDPGWDIPGLFDNGIPARMIEVILQM
jgi:hypothetical protein